MNTNEQAIIEDGGPAFPHPETGVEYYDEKMKVAGCRVYPASVGMTLRDWFAGQEQIAPSEEFGWPLLEALAGPRPKGDWNTNPLEWFNWSNRWQASVRYARADAMLERRKK